MFYPERITKIKKTDRVLEVGPGSLPHSRSDVFLDIYYNENEDITKLQRGNAKKIELKKPVIYYDGSKFPFKDNEFDYVICSHVVEHVPLKSIDLFLSELQRVAPYGYIEFPNVFYEMLCFAEVHLSFMTYKNNKLHFLDKNKFKSNFLHKAFRELYYGYENFYNIDVLSFKELYFEGFEWDRGGLNYHIVENFDDLFSEEDFSKFKNYMKSYKQNYSNRIEQYQYNDMHKELTVPQKIIKEIKKPFKKLLDSN